jgi:hypothetical protein
MILFCGHCFMQFGLCWWQFLLKKKIIKLLKEISNASNFIAFTNFIGDIARCKEIKIICLLTNYNKYSIIKEKQGD